MPENAQIVPPSSNPPILAEAEAIRRMVLLTELQNVLAAQGVRSVLVRRRRLVLHAGRHPWEPSGPTEPQLHIFAPDGTDIATTDDSRYRFASGREIPAGDPAG